MREAYDRALLEIIDGVKDSGTCLDCGAADGARFRSLADNHVMTPDRYTGIEWNEELAGRARANGINLIQGDLNNPLPFDDGSFNCVFGLSVLEHLLYPCRFIRECQRVLKDNGTFIVLTPNISTFFTAFLILAGKMPSSGPHPDSELLLSKEVIFKVSPDNLVSDAESDRPSHRHLVVFSYRFLKSYLMLAGFKNIRGYGYGLYPFPNWLQPVVEKLDPWHCHQMVFIAKK